MIGKEWQLQNRRSEPRRLGTRLLKGHVRFCIETKISSSQCPNQNLRYLRFLLLSLHSISKFQIQAIFKRSRHTVESLVGSTYKSGAMRPRKSFAPPNRHKIFWLPNEAIDKLEILEFCYSSFVLRNHRAVSALGVASLSTLSLRAFCT